MEAVSLAAHVHAASSAQQLTKGLASATSEVRGRSRLVARVATVAADDGSRASVRKATALPGRYANFSDFSDSSHEDFYSSRPTIWCGKNGEKEKKKGVRRGTGLASLETRASALVESITEEAQQGIAGPSLTSEVFMERVLSELMDIRNELSRLKKAQAKAAKCKDSSSSSSSSSSSDSENDGMKARRMARMKARKEVTLVPGAPEANGKSVGTFENVSQSQAAPIDSSVNKSSQEGQVQVALGSTQLPNSAIQSAAVNPYLNYAILDVGEVPPVLAPPLPIALPVVMPTVPTPSTASMTPHAVAAPSQPLLQPQAAAEATAVNLKVTGEIEVCMGGKCKRNGGEEIVSQLQSKISAFGSANQVVVETCKCMGKCKSAPNVRVWKDTEEDATLEMYVTSGDVDEILAKHYSISSQVAAATPRVADSVNNAFNIGTHHADLLQALGV